MKEAFRKLAKKILVAVYRLVFALSRTKPGMIAFSCSNATNYTGSPRAFYEYLVRHGLDQTYECVWFFRRGKRPDNLPGRCRAVTVGSLSYLRAVSRAQVWIFDARNLSFLKKRDDQHYIQIWHGTPLKKIGLDIDTAKGVPAGGDLAQYKRDFYQNTRIWDILVAQNDYSAELFRRCFAFEKEILPIGYPRNDVLFSENDPESIRRVRQELGLPQDKQILLYAPTYRDDEYDEAGRQIFTPRIDFRAMRAALGEEAVIAVKAHYFIENTWDADEFAGFVYPFGADADISRLFLAADKLITDYSSVMFDYSLLRRPMFFYCYDLEQYRDESCGFYFDLLAEAPGPVVRTTEELIEALRTPEDELNRAYAERREAFYKKYHTYEDGTAACARLADRVAKITGQRGDSEEQG